MKPPTLLRAAGRGVLPAILALSACNGGGSPTASVAIPTSIETVAPSATPIADRTPVATEYVSLVAPSGWIYQATEPGQIGLYHPEFDVTVLVAATLQPAPTTLDVAVAAHRAAALAADGGEVCQEQDTQSALPVPGHATFICHPGADGATGPQVTSQLVGVSEDGMIVYTVLSRVADATAEEAFDLIEVAILPSIRWTYTADPRIGAAP